MMRRFSRCGCRCAQSGREGKRQEKSAFSLIEILVLVSVCAVLAVLLFGAVGGVLERSKQAKCMGQLRALGNAFFSFAADNNGVFPRAFIDNGSSAAGTWMRHLAPYLDLKESDIIGVTTLKCPAESQYTNSMYAVNYIAVIGVEKGQTGVDWLEKGTMRLGKSVDSRAFLLADGFGGYVYTPSIWGLTRDEDHDGINDSGSLPYNGLDFRHNRRANFFLLNGSIVSLTSAQWATNTENIWGEPR